MIWEDLEKFLIYHKLSHQGVVDDSDVLYFMGAIPCYISEIDFDNRVVTFGNYFPFYRDIKFDENDNPIPTIDGEPDEIHMKVSFSVDERGLINYTDGKIVDIKTLTEDVRYDIVIAYMKELAEHDESKFTKILYGLWFGG